MTRSWLVHGTRSRSLRARPAGGLPHRYAARRTIREYGVAFGGRQSCCGQRSRGSCRAATRGAQRAPLQPLHAIPSWPWQIAARELVRRSEAGCVERPCAASRSPLVVGEAWDIVRGRFRDPLVGAVRTLAPGATQARSATRALLRAAGCIFPVGRRGPGYPRPGSPAPRPLCGSGRRPWLLQRLWASVAGVPFLAVVTQILLTGEFHKF